MTIHEAAKMLYPKDNEQDYSRRLDFEKGAEWIMQKALGVLDEMFIDRAAITVGDWFWDSPNGGFQGREEFKKRMSE